MRLMRWVPLGLLVTVAALNGAAPPGRDLPLPPEFSDYRTVHTAIRSRIAMAVPATGVAPQPGYLGMLVEANGGRFVVAGLDASSPASRAGLAVGDVVLKVDGKPIKDTQSLGEQIRDHGPNKKLIVVVERNGSPVELTATLVPASRPLTAGPRVVLGVQIEMVEEGVKLTSVTSGMPADKAKLKAGDLIIALDGEKLAGRILGDSLSGKKPGDQVRLTIKRDGKVFDTTAQLALESSGRGKSKGRGKSWDDRQTRVFRKPVFKLAVVAIEYPDVKHNAKIKPTDWEQSLFSTASYTRTSVTGQKVHGSMNDYYLEQSLGEFSVTGKFFDWVEVKRKRAEYSNDSNRYALMTEALDKLLARNGKNALDGYDGIYFLYAGDRFQTRRGGLYWPHRASMSHNGKRWAYFICPEGGRTIASISVITHEFGHMLGMPDLYARPEVPGEEGLGVWCTMSSGHGRDGKPLHFSAWCKEQLGWLKPIEIDPRVKQKIVLAPVNGSRTECVKIPLRTDGSEYLLLENRRRISFDRDLPAEGLLIWRVLNGRPILEESHGISGPSGPQTFLGSIPYPSGSNTAFTPHTTPSSKSLKGGGYPVYITNIKKLADGRVAFQVGYEYH